jgi:putative phosphoribosyl transferase
MAFRDREDAGRQLADRLQGYAQAPDTVVLGIPRGGIVVAATVAKELRLPLGVCAVHKLGAPGNPELAIGAVDDEGGTVIDWDLVRRLRVGERELEAEVARQQAELRRWVSQVAGVSPSPNADRQVILVDDGIATGATARAAVQAVRRRGARRVVLAVPVAPRETAVMLRALVDEWVCLSTPYPFFAVGNFFEQWPQVSDAEVQALVAAAGNTA